MDIPNWQVFNAELIMNEASEILVEPNNQIVLEKNNIHGCNHMWKGVRVLNGRAFITSNDPIADAQFAINLQGNSTKANIRSNRFVADFVGVNAGLAPLATADISIGNNRFLCPGNMLQPYVEANLSPQFPFPGNKTYSGIRFGSVPNADVNTNTFDGIRNGLISTGSSFAMKACTLQNLVDEVGPWLGNFNLNNHGVFANQGVEVMILDNFMQNLRKGILARRVGLHAEGNTIHASQASHPTFGLSRAIESDGTQLNRVITINANPDIQAAGDGIVVNGALVSQQLQVAGNTVTMPNGSNTGIWGMACREATFNYNFISGFCDRGMRLENLNKSDLVANTVEGLGRQGIESSAGSDDLFLYNYAFNTPEDGFLLENSSGLETYCQNYSDGNLNGFRFNGTCPSDFKCSSIGGASGHGLLLGPNAMTNIGKQEFKSNIWSGSDAFHSGGIPDLINQSQFICDPSETPNWNTAGGQIGPWFFEEFGPTGCPVSCPEPRRATIGPVTATEPLTASQTLGASEQQAALGGYPDPAFNWMARQSLYRRLRQAPERAGDHPDIAAFYAAAHQTPLGQLYDLEQKIALLLERTPTEQGLHQHLLDSFLTASAALKLLRQNQGTDAEVAEKSEELALHHAQLLAFEADLEDQMLLEADSLLLENAAIGAPNLCAQNEKDWNDLYLRHRLWRTEEPDTATLAALRQIADQCPFGGGFAVYRARTLYRRFVPAADWPAADACGAEERSAPAVLETSFCRVYPNPATGIAQLSASLPGHKEGQFELYTPTGGLALSRSLPTGHSSTLLDLSGLPSGVYYYRLRGETAVLAFGKLVIQH